MSAFATMFGISKLVENEIRVGISFNQFKILSTMFTYFEKHVEEHLIDAWYCNRRTSSLPWTILGKLRKDISSTPNQFQNWNVSDARHENNLKIILTDQPKDKGFLLPMYLNKPSFYVKHLAKLRKIFRVNEDIFKKAKYRISNAQSKVNNSVPDAIIGIHVRANKEYKNHLKTFNSWTQLLSQSYDSFY